MDFESCINFIYDKFVGLLIPRIKMIKEPVLYYFSVHLNKLQVN